MNAQGAPQCRDEIDNDNDGLIDLNDPRAGLMISMRLTCDAPEVETASTTTTISSPIILTTLIARRQVVIARLRSASMTTRRFTS